MHSQPKSHTILDSFAIMGLNRNPWLDPAELKECYLQKAKDAHPDNTPTEKGSESKPDQEAARINQAFSTLENSSTRIAHFLYLETGLDLTQDRNVPEELVTLFMELGPLFQQADRLIKSVKNEDSQILRARHFMAASPLLSKLSTIQDKLSSSLQSIGEQTKDVQERWSIDRNRDNPESRQEIIQSLTQIYQKTSFLQRWLDTINEKSFELTPC